MSHTQRITIHSDRLYRLSDVLQVIPVSRSTWYAGIRDGRFPVPIALGPRTSAYRGADIIAVCEGVYNRDPEV